MQVFGCPYLAQGKWGRVSQLGHESLLLSVGQPHQYFWLSGDFFYCPGRTDNQNFERCFTPTVQLWTFYHCPTIVLPWWALVLHIFKSKYCTITFKAYMLNWQTGQCLVLPLQFFFLYMGIVSSWVEHSLLDSPSSSFHRDVMSLLIITASMSASKIIL